MYQQSTENPHWGVIFGTYVAYFIGVVLISSLLDYFCCFDRLVGKLSDPSFQNMSRLLRALRRKEDARKRSRSQQLSVSSLEKKVCCALCCIRCRCSCCAAVDGQTKSLYDLAFVPSDDSPQHDMNFSSETQSNLRPMSSESVSIDNSDNEGSSSTSRGCCKCSSLKSEAYSETYFTELSRKKCYLCCSQFSIPELREKAPNWLVTSLDFPAGYWNDMALYLMNNHVTLSMFMSVRGHPNSRAAKRLTSFCINTLTFMVVNLLQLANLPYAAYKVITIMILAPSTLAVRNFFFTLLACPCLRKQMERIEEENRLYDEFKRKRKCCCNFWVSVAHCFGVLFAYPLISIFIVLLILSAMFGPDSTTYSSSMGLVVFAYSVHVVAAGIDILHTFVLFWTGDSCYQLTIGKRVIFTIGKYYLEKIDLLNLQSGTDYVFVSNQYDLLSISCNCVRLVAVHRIKNNSGGIAKEEVVNVAFKDRRDDDVNRASDDVL